MNNLARRATGAQPASRHAGDQDSPAVSTEGTEWSGSVLDIACTGIKPTPTYGPVIHSAFVAAPGVRRAPDQQWYRSRIGWIAQQRAVTVVEARQRLAALPDGRFRPSGDWSNVTVQRCAAVGEPTRRIGDVAADDGGRSGPNPPPSSPSTDLRSQVPADLDYLPLILRQGLAAAAANPTWFEAQAVHYTRPDGSSYHSVGVIKVSDHEAVSLVATRQHGSATWQAEQVHFSYVRTDEVAVSR